MFATVVQTVYEFESFSEMLDFARKNGNAVSYDFDVDVVFKKDGRCVLYNYYRNEESDCLDRFINPDGTVNEKKFASEYVLKWFAGRRSELVNGGKHTV